MWSGIDRRKFPRAHYRCLIYITRKEVKKTISTYTENIGAGGICVIVNEDLGLFKGVELELDLKNGVDSPIKCSGTIVWVVKKRDVKGKNEPQYDTGIEFVGMDEKNALRIEKIVENVLKKVQE